MAVLRGGGLERVPGGLGQERNGPLTRISEISWRMLTAVLAEACLFSSCGGGILGWWVFVFGEVLWLTE